MLQHRRCPVAFFLNPAERQILNLRVQRGFLPVRGCLAGGGRRHRIVRSAAARARAPLPARAESRRFAAAAAEGFGDKPGQWNEESSSSDEIEENTDVLYSGTENTEDEEEEDEEDYEDDEDEDEMAIFNNDSDENEDES